MKLFYALGFFGQLQNGVTATDYEGQYFFYIKNQN